MIDSHCHLADEVYVVDLDAVVERARAAEVDAALCILEASDEAEAARAERVAALWPEVRFAVGVHPHRAGAFADRFDGVESSVVAAIARTPGARAIGEIGLDYHYDFAPRETQREVFRRQVRLARARGWPVVIHTREADDDTLAILREEGRDGAGGVFHCFTGDGAAARRALDLGFHLSFSGIVTFPKADAIRHAARLIPADRLLAETDSPYLTPVPHRHVRRNEPRWVTLVAAELAAARGEPLGAVVDATDRAFHALFKP